MPVIRAAIYLRSSKDRSDVSIDAQRRQLQQLASERGYLIAAEYADVVESGKDDQRPGFQSLVSAVRNRRRGWDALLILDTSRLARRRHIALIFEEVECRKHGVKVVYKSLPDSDPITEMLLKSILQAMDEWHSLTSKAKGLAGMAENVRRGWRAGGRAPMGYRLEHVETGAVREGSPVVKSRLVPSEEAGKVAAYLKARAGGVTRRSALAEAGLSISETTAVGIEWNATTYAGHTVWNQRYEVTAGGYTGGVKRRPRHEWIIQKATHDPLITDEEAEILVRALETSTREASRRTQSDYLLSGLLKDKDGKPFHGDGEGFYRVGKGRRIKAATIETAVLAQLVENLRAGDFVKAFTAAAKAQAESRKKDVDLPRMRKELAEIERMISRLTGLLGQTTTPDPLLRQIETHEVRRVALEEEVTRRSQIEAEADKVRGLTEAQVARILRALAEDVESLDRDRLKDFVRGLLEKVEIDLAASTFQISYRLSAGDRVASPRLGQSIPGVLMWFAQSLRAA